MIKIPRYKIVLSLLDYLILMLSLVGAEYIIYSFTHRAIRFNGESFLLSFSLLSVTSIFFIFVFQAQNLYKINIFLKRAVHLVALLKSLLIGIISLIILTYLFKFPFVLDSRLYILVFAFLFILNFIVFRIALFRGLYLKFSRMELMHRNVAIVGAGKTGHFVAAKLLLENSYGIRVVGFIDDNIPKGEMITSNLEVLGDVESLRLLKGIFNIEEVIIAIDNIDYSRLLQIIDICNEIRISIKVTSELFSIIPQKLSIEQYFDIPTVNATLTINESLNSFFKRIFDLITAIFGLMLLSPIFLLLAFLIKITSRGPVFYMQERIGYKGVPFKFYKFRSMTGKEEDDTERKSKMIEFMKNRAKTTEGIKIVNESRVTWIGKIIRKTSIDELPQLFNVVKGEMSLVGPRPCLPYEFANYDEWQKRRVSVLPGCTGLWQVSGRSEVSFKDSVVLDLYYINNMSPWLDLQIILKTIPVMILSRGGK